MNPAKPAPRVDRRSTAPRWQVIDHVQLAIPPGGEDAAREFWVGRLGFAEVPKPAALAVRGGAWFEAGGVRVHVGIDPAFVPAGKAHPALAVDDLVGFVAAAGLDVVWSDEIPGTTRCHLRDPFGNRLELVDACEDPAR